MAKLRFIHTSGKRKSAIARATIKPGKGSVKINSVPLDLYFPKIARLRIMEPILLSGDIAKDVDIKVNVFGGGWSSQAEASRLAISKGLIEYSRSEELKKKLLVYDRHLLVADTRKKETKKPLTHGRARAKRQKSKR